MFINNNIINDGTPSGDFLRPYTHWVSGTGYRSHLDKLVYLNLVPGSTRQPSLNVYYKIIDSSIKAPAISTHNVLITFDVVDLKKLNPY
jgi:hypothetical protein